MSPRTEFYGSFGDLETELGTFVAEFIQTNPDIDMDGALFVPFDGIDLTTVQSTELVVKLRWDVVGSFNNPGGTGSFEMDDRVNGTPFDFRASVEAL